MGSSIWLLPTLASLVAYVVGMALFAAVFLRRRRRPEPPRTPAAPRRSVLRVSVLKPLAGWDDDLDANLASFASLDYPSFEILLGVASVRDPALAAARRFVATHPAVDARIVLTEPDEAINPKVAQLLGLERAATGDVLVISDSNVRVTPAYLWPLVAELADERVGMVTSLFAGTGERTLGAALENLQLCATTTPGIVVAGLFTARPLTVGKSMAVRRADLAKLGGFARVSSVLAEDHVLGRIFMDAGFAAKTTFCPVENRNVDCTFRRTLERHTRWTKMRRALAPVGFPLEPLMTPLVVATACAVLEPGKATVAMAVIAALAQTVCALVSVRLIRGHALEWRYAPLEILRSYVVLYCWFRACVSKRVEWRGHAFTLRPGSVIVPVRHPLFDSVVKT